MNVILIFQNLSFFPFFNIIMGIIGILIGFEYYKPFKKDLADKYHNKYGTFFKLGGIGMLTWGLIKLFF